jgi:hypothetical protein
VEGTPLLNAVAGQIAWILPWIWVPLVLLLVVAARRGPHDPARWLLVCLGAGPPLFFTLLPLLGRRGLPHWQAPGYFMLLPLLGAAAAARLDGGERWARRWLWGSCVGLAAVVAAIGAQLSTGWMGAVVPALVEKGDPTDDLLQWKPVAVQLREWGYPREGVVLAGTIWSDAGKLAYALGSEVPVASVGEDPRGFGLVQSQQSLVGRDVVLVARRRPGPEPLTTYAPYFRSISILGTIPLRRRKGHGVAVSVYLGRELLRPVRAGRQ